MTFLLAFLLFFLVFEDKKNRKSVALFAFWQGKRETGSTLRSSCEDLTWSEALLITAKVSHITWSKLVEWFVLKTFFLEDPWILPAETDL